MKKWNIWAMAFVLSTFFCIVDSAWGTMTDLGALGGTNSYAFAINNNGQIVGSQSPIGNSSNKDSHAFLYTTPIIFNGRVINFNNYIDYTNNDYKNNFGEGEYCTPGYYVQVTSGGITGGALIPKQWGGYGSDITILKKVFNNIPGKNHKIAMAFLYNSLLANPTRTNTLIELELTPALPADPNHNIRCGVRGIGTALEIIIYGYYNNSRVILPELTDNHWYRFQKEVNNIGEQYGQVVVEASIFDLGISGLNKPTIISSASMARYYDIVFSSVNKLQCSIFSEQWGGTSSLDNFEVNISDISPVYYLLLEQYTQ
jgi:probable HAF family extracellular repeat protein